jgi:hypothetical protein
MRTNSAVISFLPASTCRFSDLLGHVLDLLEILQPLGEVLYSVPNVLYRVLKFFFGGIKVPFGVVTILTGVCGIPSALGKIANRMAEILNKMFKRRDGGREIIIGVFEIILRVGKVLILDLAEALDGFPELAANATVFFCGIDVIGNDVVSMS